MSASEAPFSDQKFIFSITVLDMKNFVDSSVTRHDY